MTTNELQQTIVLAGHECRVKGDEVALHICPYCGNAKWNCEANAAKGVFHCWACRTHGRLDRFLHELTGQHFNLDVNLHGPQVRQPRVPDAATTGRVVEVDAVPSAVIYLESRGITPHLAKQFGLKVCVEEGHRLYGRLLIPALDYWDPTQQIGWVGRSYSGGRPKYLSTMPYSTVTGWRAGGPFTPAVVVEGHFDGIAVRLAGFSAAVLGGITTPGITDWAARVPGECPIVILLDPDAREAARRLFWTVRAVRGATGKIQVGLLPAGKDPSAVGPEGIRAVLDNIGLSAW